MPELTFALDLCEFALRYSIAELYQHSVKRFQAIIQENNIHISFLNLFLRLKEDFELPYCMKRFTKLISAMILEKLILSFELEVAVKAKEPSKAFRDVFSSVTAKVYSNLAKRLQKRGYGFIIARRCSDPSCHRAEDTLEHCSYCKTKRNIEVELGLVAYPNEQIMNKLHWETPSKLKQRKSLFCLCDEEADGNMIQCDGIKCATKWFHLECVGLMNEPDGRWYCTDCENVVNLPPFMPNITV